MKLRFDEKDYYVRVRHVKYPEPLVCLSDHKVTHLTAVYVSCGEERVGGAAECSSKDQFSRKVGRRVALGRALKSLGWSHEKRKAFLRELEKPRPQKVLAPVIDPDAWVRATAKVRNLEQIFLKRLSEPGGGA